MNNVITGYCRSLFSPPAFMMIAITVNQEFGGSGHKIFDHSYYEFSSGMEFFFLEPLSTSKMTEILSGILWKLIGLVIKRLVMIF